MSKENEKNKEIMSAWKDLDESDKQRYRDLIYEKKRLRGRSLEQESIRLFAQDYAEIKKAAAYRRGPEGMIEWVEENVRFRVPVGDRYVWVYPPDLPDTPDKYGRSPASFWEGQKEIIRQALEIDPETGLYRRKLIVFCWPRGESKSFITVLIALYRFFCFPFQQIFFASNSKDQTDVLHFGVAKEIIQNSPKLIQITGAGGITETEIRIFTEGRGRFNTIQLLSTASGIVSNAHVITQSEAFEMADDTFFTKWSGSLRNTPNAIGIIDTTASRKEHWLYKNLYKAYLRDPNGKLFFSYRCSPKADPMDFWSPWMDEKELAHFESTMTSGDFAAFFKNLWDASENELFDPIAIQAMRYIGINGVAGGRDQVVAAIRYQEQLEKTEEFMASEFSRGTESDGYWEANPERYESGTKGLWDIHDVLNLGRHSDPDPETVRTHSRWITTDEIINLTSIYSTHWALLVGIDRADPLKYKGRLQARTAITAVLKGLPGSLGKSPFELNKANLKYTYILISLAIVENSQLSGMISVLERLLRVYARLDMVCGENYGLGDVVPWCDKNGVPFLSYYPSKDRQRLGYTELISSISDGRFKAPAIPVNGIQGADIFREEIENLDDVSRDPGSARVKPKLTGNSVPKYGSPTKYKKGGIQDDVPDALCWTVYGGIKLTAADFKPREKTYSGNIGGIFPGIALVSNFMRDFHRRR